MKFDNELKALNEFLLSKHDNDIELDIKLEKMKNNSKFQLLIDRVLEIEQLKNGLLEFEINDNENEDELEYLNDLLTLNLENYKNFKNIVSNKRYKEIVRFIIKLKSNFRRLKK